MRDPTEPVFPSVVVQLLSSTGSATTSTNALGQYTFAGVLPGVSYEILVRLTNSSTAFSPSFAGSDSDITNTNATAGWTSPFLVSVGANITVDAGIILYSSISGKAFLDSNRNALYEAGFETLVSGIPVKLYSVINFSSPLQTTTTDASGHYTFIKIMPGTYQLEFDIDPLTRTFTTPALFGSDPSIDSDVTSFSELTGVGWTSDLVIITSPSLVGSIGQSLTNIDAGIVDGCGSYFVPGLFNLFSFGSVR
jgi:hypothetical protein